MWSILLQVVNQKSQCNSFPFDILRSWSYYDNVSFFMQPIYFSSIQLTPWPARVSEKPFQCYRAATMCRDLSAFISVQWGRRWIMELSNSTLHWVEEDWCLDITLCSRRKNTESCDEYLNVKNTDVYITICYACCITQVIPSKIHNQN